MRQKIAVFTVQPDEALTVSSDVGSRRSPNVRRLRVLKPAEGPSRFGVLKYSGEVVLAPPAASVGGRSGSFRGQYLHPLNHRLPVLGLRACRVVFLGIGAVLHNQRLGHGLKVAAKQFKNFAASSRRCFLP